MEAALAALASLLGPMRIASLYRGSAVPASSQPAYLNTVAVAATELPPDAVLAVAKRLELAAGRRPGVRDAARPLDIDLLVFDDERRPDAELTLPHPRLRTRRFVLEPLAELWPDLHLPPDGASPVSLLRDLAAPPLERLPWPAAVRGRLAGLVTLPSS